MGIDLTGGVGAVAGLADTIISRLWPDKTEQERAQMAAALTIVQGQLDANKAEAASPSAFTSGWRPAIGWICGVAIGCQYIVRPVLQWATALSGHPMPDLPGLDDTLWQLLLGMLGLGGLRTVEKIKGAAK
jgi:hypothetical protein